MPKQNQNLTYTTTFRGQVCELAVLAKWFTDKGLIPTSRNQLLQAAVTLVVENLKQTAKDLNLDDPQVALEYLAECGLSGPAMTKRLAPQLAQINLETETGPKVPNAAPVVQASRKKTAQDTAVDIEALMAQAQARRAKDDTERAKLAYSPSWQATDHTHSEENNN